MLPRPSDRFYLESHRSDFVETDPTHIPAVLLSEKKAVYST